MFEAVSVITLILSSYLIVRVAGIDEKSEVVLTFFCVTAAQIVLSGYLLSSINHLGDVRVWAAFGVINLLVVVGIAKVNGSIRPGILPDVNFGTLRRGALSVKKWYIDETSGFEKLLITPLLLVTASLGALNLAIIVSTAPHNYDSMAYHLARMAYYLQHNNLDYYPANYWAQVVHPKNSTLLLLYSYLMSGRNENMTQLVQYFSYWVSVCSVYGIARKTGNSSTHAFFAALVSALFVEWLLESTTTQNDLIITAYIGSAVNFLFCFRETQQKKYLTLAALAVGLSIGTSAKSLATLPALILVAGYVLFCTDMPQKRLRVLAYFSLSVVFAVVLFALPAGYIENYRHFGSPVGSAELREFSFEAKPLNYVARNGTKNLLRYGFEFLSLDGFPPFGLVQKAQSLLTAIPKVVMSRLGIDLESPEAVIKPFSYRKPPIFFSQEDWCSWGIFGFGLVWITVFLFAARIMRSGDMRVLSFAAILFMLAHAYAGPYDPHRGRYFVTCAVFAAPTIGMILQKGKKFVQSYVLVIVLLGCISALSGIILRPARPPVSMKVLSEFCPDIRQFEFLPLSVFAMDRVAQLTTNAWDLYPPIRAFDLLVPKDATVAVFLPGDTYEYPLFGKHLTRTLVPINSFVGGFQAIPANADYLLYAKGFPLASANDLHLGADWFLRRLPGARDEAVEYFKAALKLSPDNAPHHNMLGIEYAARGLLYEAIEEFRVAVSLEPAERSYRSNLEKATTLKKADGNANPDINVRKRK